MNHSPNNFAKAFMAALKETTKEKHTAILENFLALIQKYRMGGKISKIVREIDVLYLKQSGGRKIILETARPLSDKMAHQITARFDKKDKVEIKIKPEIIAGIKILIDDEMALDGTLQRKLKKLFRYN